MGSIMGRVDIIENFQGYWEKMGDFLYSRFKQQQIFGSIYRNYFYSLIKEDNTKEMGG